MFWLHLSWIKISQTVWLWDMNNSLYIPFIIQDSLDDAMPNGDKSHESFDFSAYKQSRKLWMDLFEANGRRGKDICA